MSGHYGGGLDELFLLVDRLRVLTTGTMGPTEF